MKLVKMSLAAAMLMGASAFAIENTKVSGDAKLYYHTTDQGDGNDLLSKNGAAGQAALGLGLTTDLLKGVSAGAHLTALTTLGLQGQLVSNVWEGTNGLTDTHWFDEAWMAATLGKTTAKVGRMALDTPLVFTETWSIAENTFEGAVLLNQDLPDTTLVAAYVGGSNGTSILRTNAPAVGIGNTVGTMGSVAGLGADPSNFGQFYNGAYAFGVVNNSYKPLTAQAWYYDATRVIQAYWLQADLKMKGLVAGLQYTGQQVQDATVPNADSQSAYALKVGYETEMFTISAAYSATGDKGPINVGGNLIASGQSKLYTEAWWNYGWITQVDTTAYNLSATATFANIDLGAYYTSADQSKDKGDADMNEFTLTASKTFGALDTTLVYINSDALGGVHSPASRRSNANAVQAYLTLNF